MISLLKPIHVAVAVFLFGVFGASAVVLATASTDGGTVDRGALIVTATFVRDSLYASDEGPAPTPEPALPPAAPVIESDDPAVIDPPPPPPEEPPAEPAAPPPHRSCEEIRTDGTYLDDAERSFFLESCLSSVSSAARSSASPPARAAVTSESERAYTVKAVSIANSALIGLHRYSRDQVTTSADAAIEYGGLAGGWANQMDNFGPIPSRFQATHQRLQATLWELAAHTRMLAAGQASLDDSAYVDQLNALIEAANSAIAEYFQTLGLALPQA
jgi:hypothetical protein